MSLRRRLTLACAAAVALAVVLAAGLTYWFVRDALRDQIDASLRDAKPFSVELAPEAGQRLQRIVGARLEASSPLDGPVLFAQALGPGGRIEVPPGEEPVQLLPAADLEAVAAGEREQFFADVELAGRHLRVYTAPTPGGGALQVARSLDEVDGTLATLRIGLAAVALLGVVAALALARLATRTAVKPVAELTDAAEHVARTRDLTRRIERDGNDELSRLAGAFNTMLEALEASQRAQRRLVADASHELRTPLTSLRTNLEVLGRGGLDAIDHERLRVDVNAQLEELTLLVSDLVDLAREE
jgi:two-component system sensor histidine kinase MprB